MRHPLLFAAGLFSALCSAQIQTDPCKPGEYQILNQTYRSTGYDTRATDTPVCDNKLKKGWYRFIDVGGESVEMPTSCQGTNKCGTVTPLWMNGSHPTIEAGIVIHDVCGMVNKNDPNGNCCDYTDTLFVKNCDGFYIYYLSLTPDCPAAYCAGTRKRCSENQRSSTGFEPCRDLAPQLDALPVTKGPVINADKKFFYHCTFEFGPKDADQRFEVAWTFDGQPDPSIQPEILTGAQRVATLSSDKLQAHTDKKVQCKISTYYAGTPQFVNIYLSNITVFGVETVLLTGPNLQGSMDFSFQCEITSPADDANQKIEIVWTFNGIEDPKIKPRIISGKSRTVKLPGSALKGHFNSKVGCQARLVFEKSDIKTIFVKSNAYFAGIQIIPENVQIRASEGEKVVTVISTLPVVCNRGKTCCLTLKLSIDKNTVASLKDTCDPTICLSDWDNDKKQASVTITIVAAVTIISSGTWNAVLTIEQLSVSGTGLFSNLVAEYRPKPIQIVIILEPRYTCPITGDPHFILYDNPDLIVDLYRTGDYTVAVVKERDFIAQIRTWPCGAVTCACGLVVKDKNNIIRVHGCDRPDRLYTLDIDIPYPLSEGTTVKRSADGRNIGIQLQSATEIKILLGTFRMDIYITNPASDKNKIKGVCGTNDGNPANDFTHPDGTITPVCSSGPQRCIPEVFTESWRVTGNASLFVTVPDAVQEKPDNQVCACVINSKGKSEYSCSPRQHIQEANLACTNCQTITKDLKPTPWGKPGFEEKPYVHKPVAPVDPNQKCLTVEGVGETEARDLCTKAIQKSKLYKDCQNIKTVADSTIDQCIGDTCNGGTTQFVDIATDIFTSLCQLDVAKDEKNYVKGPDGKLNLKPEFGCPPECLNHGKCGEDGKCECQAGWEGENCQIEKGKGPQISRTEGSVCHDSAKPCENVQFQKSNVNINDKLTCRVQAVDEKGKAIGKPFIQKAIHKPSPTVTCPLPKTGKSSQKYTVAVRNGNGKYSNELPVQVYDPTCLECENSGCRAKDTACHINNVCYKDGEINKKNAKQACNVKRSTTAWTSDC